MKRLFGLVDSGAAAPLALAATAFFALATILGMTMLPDGTVPEAEIRIEPDTKIVTVGETFTIEVVVESSVPVNVFAGKLNFNPEVLVIDSIDYNTSIADLWAELPWYSNGAGTLTFGGGTTHSGGFQGIDTLIKVSFKTLKEGEGTIYMSESRILLHDGLGTDAQLAETKDAIFTIGQDSSLNSTNVSTDGLAYKVAQELPSTDLNGDGKQSIADVSIFMLNIASDAVYYDFNLDGEVDLKDLNIILGAK